MARPKSSKPDKIRPELLAKALTTGDKLNALRDALLETNRRLDLLKTAFETFLRGHDEHPDDLADRPTFH